MNSGVFSRFRILGEGLGVCAKYLLLYPLLAPRRTVRFLWMLGHQILSYNRRDAHAQIPSKTLEAIFPGIERVEVTLAGASYRDGNMTTRELYTLCALARHLQTRSLLEIGTFDGLLITHLARNTDSEAHLVTVDLRPEDLQELRWPLAPGEATYVQKATIGEKIHQLPSEERSRITQLYGDSTQFPPDRRRRARGDLQRRHRLGLLRGALRTVLQRPLVEPRRFPPRLLPLRRQRRPGPPAGRHASAPSGARASALSQSGRP